MRTFDEAKVSFLRENNLRRDKETEAGVSFLLPNETCSVQTS